jgi:putative restriction endonuclease
MRYWWVNQNQTYRHEIGGGYLWSPKRSKGDRVNPFYESMREVSPGDIIFSFADTYIAAIGVARSFCYECPKPAEFGNAGTNWSTIGWKVEVRFLELINRIRPKDHIASLAELLPAQYSPLLPNGNGLQSVYLTEVGPAFARALATLIGAEARLVFGSADDIESTDVSPLVPEADITEWERRVEGAIVEAPTLRETEKQSLILARRGQGIFRDNVQRIEQRCRVTGVERPEHLVASHAKPWRDSTNEERLDGENGLLLTPTIDHLFDRGFIAFEGNGRLLVSPVAHLESLERMGVRTGQVVNVGTFSQGQRSYLEFHRANVFRMAHRRASDDRTRSHRKSPRSESNYPTME